MEENRDKINIITAEVVKYFCGTKTRLRLGGKVILFYKNIHKDGIALYG